MRLRTAQNSDAEAIAAIWRAAIRITCAPAYGFDETILSPWADDKTPERIRELIALEEFFLVADDAGSVRGFICGTFALNTFALFVAPDAQRCGTGSRLFRCYERMAEAAGETQLIFHSSLNAVSFYQRMGAEIDGPVLQHPRPCIPMRKILKNGKGSV